MPTLPQLRKKIDSLDNQIVRLLSRRMHFAEKIGAVKALNGDKIYHPKRERDLLKRLCQKKKAPFKNTELRSIYQHILVVSRAHQTRVFRSKRVK